MFVLQQNLNNANFNRKNFYFTKNIDKNCFNKNLFIYRKKKTRVFKKNDFKSIFNHKRIHDRNQTTDFYVDDSQFIFKKKRRFQTVTKKNFFRRKYEYDSNYDRHDNWKEQFYRKIIFNLKSRHNYRWNNRLSYERNNSNDYQKKNPLKRRKKIFRNYRDNFQHNHDDYFFYERKRNFRNSWNNRSIYDQRFARLRSIDVMKFDSNIIFVAFFIRRFSQIAFIEKHEAVFRIFSMCFKKTVFEWHTNLFAKIKQKINYDLKIWKNEFLRKYQSNKHESLNKIMIIIFKFNEFLTLNQYFFRKINFLHDAAITDENLMINYFWKKLNVKLTLTTSIC